MWEKKGQNHRLAIFVLGFYFDRLPATLVRTCMFSRKTSRGSRYSVARPASTSVSLLFTWFSRSRYNLHRITGFHLITLFYSFQFWKLSHGLMEVLLVFEISELFFQIRHFIQAFNSSPFTVLLIHFWN